MDFYTAYLLLCIVSPLGTESCTSAAVPKMFNRIGQCKSYIKQEVTHIMKESTLEEFRSHLPSMKEGKLKLKWRCSTPTTELWIGRDLPEVLMEIEP